MSDFNPLMKLGNAYRSMKRRCLNQKWPGFKFYGGRVPPVTIHPSWLGPSGRARFDQDVGIPASADLQLDRIDNDRGYEPGNVRWATRSQQNRNRRDTRLVLFRGQRIALMTLAERFGVSSEMLHKRLSSGDTVEEALARPLHERRARYVPTERAP